MAHDPALAILSSLEGYRKHFMDVELWRIKIENVCHGFGWDCEQIQAGVAGTFPTFIVDRKLVVKFFGQLFDGVTCWKVEQEAAQRLGDHPPIPVAKLLANGQLQGAPGWRFLLFEYSPGNSLREVYDQIPHKEKMNLARWLGMRLAEMHRTHSPGPSILPRLSRNMMERWQNARQGQEGDPWPAHLAAERMDYLQANQRFIQTNADLFIHADVTQDHLLGEFQDNGWITRALIDFGDAMSGNLYYELAALHLDLFDGDTLLLEEFLEAYGFPSEKDFIKKAMATSLMHQFDIYGHLFQRKKELRSATSLGELSQILWGGKG